MQINYTTGAECLEKGDIQELYITKYIIVKTTSVVYNIEIIFLVQYIINLIINAYTRIKIFFFP
mgnify:CR=1 FL=1